MVKRTCDLCLSSIVIRCSKKKRKKKSELNVLIDFVFNLFNYLDIFTHNNILAKQIRRANMYIKSKEYEEMEEEEEKCDSE